MFQLTKQMEGLNEVTLRILLGHFLLIFGLSSAVAYLYPFSSTMDTRFLFAGSVASVWIGVWMIKLRLPTLVFTLAWVVAMSVIWFAKYNAH